MRNVIFRQMGHLTHHVSQTCLVWRAERGEEKCAWRERERACVHMMHFLSSSIARMFERNEITCQDRKVHSSHGDK